jgi:hypothetical protein
MRRRRTKVGAGALVALATCLFVAATGGVGAGCSGKTLAQGGLMLVLRTDGSLPQATRLHIEVSSPNGATVYWNADYAVPAEATLPTSLGIATNGSATGSVEINASLWAGDAVLDERLNQVFEIPTAHVAEIDIVFSALCSARAVLEDAGATSSCPSGDTCDPSNGGCIADTVNAGTLPTFAGDAGTALTGVTQCASATSIETCEESSAASTCSAWSVTTCSADAGVTPYVCERSPAPSCVDPNWAEWPIPNAPVDSPPAPNPQSYTDNGDGTVTDNVTGLMWQQAVQNGSPSFTWGSVSAPGTAQSYCSTLALGGHDDWRVPSLIELVTIVQWGATPPINATYFPDTRLALFWSSTPVAGSSNAREVDFSFVGASVTAPTSTPNAVRCVR